MSPLAARRIAAHPRARPLDRFDRIVVPVVAVLMVIGAVIILGIWRVADDVAHERDDAVHARVDRFTNVIEATVMDRWNELGVWTERNESVLASGDAVQLKRELDAQIEHALDARTIAWLVVRANGSVTALAERTPGELAAEGIANDVLAFGRSVATRQQQRASGRLLVDDAAAVAFGVPVAATDAGAQPLAIVLVRDVSRNEVATFIGKEITGDGNDAIGNPVLLDGRGRLLAGSDRVVRGDTTRRRVPQTDWTVEITTSDPPRLLDSWFYPAFAALLILAAGAFAGQRVLQQRTRRAHAARTEQIHVLYELASRALQSQTVEDQARDLARTVMQLVDAQSASVHVTTSDGDVPVSEGSFTRGMAKARLPIIGPRSTLGELVLARSSGPLDEEETWVVQTATTLAGAAIHTLASLETERAAGAELQRLDELRSNLMATVAHELMSPLTAVKGVLGLLAMQDDLGPRGREYVGVATDRTDRLVALIRDLFDCSLLETGQLDIRPRRQLADELLDSALGAQAAARPGELRLSATPNLQITVDPVRFDQLVTNLVTNAFRHGAPPVEVAVRPTDGGVLVVITDEGPGIPAERRGDVFDKFYQGSSGPARMAEGAGLGLNLVRGLVELHGGSITIDSAHADGRGARFTVFLPDRVPGMVVSGEQPTNDTVVAPEVGLER